MENNPIVTIEMEDGGIIKAELYPDIAPQSVYNFISLANSGYYDGLIFHRCFRFRFFLSCFGCRFFFRCTDRKSVV